ncbi:DNA cytosine methyltransferase [Nocardia noduli]|uniref:DNA cytosine methyltransferase n=1 Tax=Nocardia noduli TaxID=2815722 RepID=UPI001C2160DA|nr:DNA cytosine methyltransferase [Nocardia noduli]
MPNEAAANTERTSVELFAGGGGLAIAVESAGFRPLLFNEFAKRACETLALNRARPFDVADWRTISEVPAKGERPPLVVGDVTKVNFEYLRFSEVDVLAGGPPCQPFSLGGVGHGDEDDRNGFPHMFRAVSEIRPRAVICENVRGLLRPSFSPYFDYIKRELALPHVKRAEGAHWSDHDRILRREARSRRVPDDERYDVAHFAVNAADYGVPQIRNRVIVVAFRRDVGVDLGRYASLVAPTHSEAILFEDMISGGYWDRHEKGPRDPVRRRVMERIPRDRPLPIDRPRLDPWRTLRDAVLGTDGQLPLPDIPDERLDRTEFEPGRFTHHVGWPDARVYPGHTPNELDRPAKTVKAGVHGVPGGESVMLRDDGTHRYMTVRETARVMTFPDSWELAGPRGEKMRQLGNAVPVQLGKAFADAIATVLDEAKPKG